MDVWAKHVPASGEAPYASTYYAHPLACAGTLAALERLASSELRAEVESKGSVLAERLGAIVRGRAHVATRSIGLLAAVEFVGAGPLRPPDPARARAVLRSLLGSGILAIPGGLGGNVVSLYPSLVIPREQLDAALRRLESAVEAGSG